MNEHRPSFINNDRYVHVADMKLGQSGSYTDFEELAFCDEEDPEWLTKLVSTISIMVWDQHRADQENRNLCDLVFYNTAHVLFYWNDCGTTITDDMVQLVVETALHMLDSVLGCDDVMRRDTDDVNAWKELWKQNRPETFTVRKHNGLTGEVQVITTPYKYNDTEEK